MERIQLGKVDNLLFLAAVMRRRVEGAAETAFRIDAVGIVASQLEREDARYV